MDDRELLNLLAQQPRTCLQLVGLLGLDQTRLSDRLEALQQAGVALTLDTRGRWSFNPQRRLLDASIIRGAVHPTLWHQVNQLDIGWSVDSTNTALLDRSVPDTGINIFLAEHQVEGRGRRGRRWASPIATNIYASVSCVLSGSHDRLVGLSIAVGVAVAKALRHMLPSVATMLKWPNDIVVADKKLGGILIESRRYAPNRIHAVVGIGINTYLPPLMATEIEQPWTDLETLTGRIIDRNQLIGCILNRLISAFQTYEIQGIFPFIHQFEPFDNLRGRDISVKMTGEGTLIFAAACGIAEDGGLRINVSGVERVVHSGEVIVRL